MEVLLAGELTKDGGGIPLKVKVAFWMSCLISDVLASVFLFNIEIVNNSLIYVF